MNEPTWDRAYMPPARGQDPMISPTVVGLLALGLAAHVVAAWINGSGHIAYVHHVAGFFIIATVTGAVIGGLTWLFWRAYRRRALLVFAAMQAVLGILVAVGELRA